MQVAVGMPWDLQIFFVLYFEGSRFCVLWNVRICLSCGDVRTCSGQPGPG